MVAAGVPIFGTHHDLGDYTVVILDNAPYNSIFVVRKEGRDLKNDYFRDNDGNRIDTKANRLRATSIGID